MEKCYATLEIAIVYYAPEQIKVVDKNIV